MSYEPELDVHLADAEPTDRRSVLVAVALVAVVAAVALAILIRSLQKSSVDSSPVTLPPVAEVAMDTSSEIGAFVAAAVASPSCSAGALGSALGIEFTPSDSSATYQFFEAQGRVDVDWYQYRQLTPDVGLLIAFMPEGTTATRDQVAQALISGENLGAAPLDTSEVRPDSPQLIDETWTIAGTKIHSVYERDGLQSLAWLSWECTEQ